MRTYLTTNGYCRQQFGEKIYRLAMSGAVSCPNRDGTAGVGGCLFCSAGGSGDFAAPAAMAAEDQVAWARARLGEKGKAIRRFIAYFQSYTGTYGDLDQLERLYRQTALREDVAALAIGTRPDCLGGEVLRMLDRLAAIKPLWIELGLQTCHDETAALINRGYPYVVYEEAMAHLGERPIHRITHVILGLPGEDKEAMLETVRQVGKLTDGIKLQLLHILKGTPLGECYEAQTTGKDGGEAGMLPKIRPLGFEKYVSLTAEAVSCLPTSVVIHRLTGDGPRSSLMAPLWSTDKKRVLNAVHRELRNRDICLL